MARMRTRSIQFNVSQGENPLPDATILLCEANDPLSLEAQKGELILILEATHELANHRHSLQLVMRTVRKLFYESTSLSIQSSLRRAVVAANKTLYEYNLSQPPSRRASFGLTCAIIKGTDLYVAQVMPSQLYMLSDGQVRAIPAGPLWQKQTHTVSLAGTSGQLGGSITLEPELYRAVILPGESIVLVTSNMARYLHREQVAQMLRFGYATHIAQQIRAIAIAQSAGDVYGIAVVLDPAVPDEIKQPTGAFYGITQQLLLAGDTTGLWAHRFVTWVRGLLFGNDESKFTQSIPRWRGRVRREQQRIYQKPPEVTYQPDPVPNVVPIDLGESIEEIAERDNRQSRVPVSQSTPRVIDAFEVEVPITPVDLDYHSRPRYQKQITEPIRYGELASSLAQRIFDWRWVPRMPSSPAVMQSATRGEGLSYRKQRPRFPWAMLAATVAVFAVLFFYGINVARENRLQRGENQIQDAEMAVQAIYDSADENEAFQRIEIAKTVLTDLQQTGLITMTTTNRQRYLVMSNRIDSAEKIVQRRTDLENISLVASHPVPAGTFHQIVIPPVPDGYADTTSFNNIYLLDRNRGVIYQMGRDQSTMRPILQAGDQVADLVIGSITDIAWRSDNIIAIAQSSDNGPYIYLFRNGDTWNYSILAGSMEWNVRREAFRLSSFSGNLYIWGVVPDNVLRFFSSAIADFPEPWIQNDGGNPLAEAVDMTIDGRIYLLHPDGRIFVLYAFPDGERAVERVIDAPKVVPAIQTVGRIAMTGDGESGSFYLLDSYLGRIIQVEKRTGKFIQQIVLPTEGEFVFDALSAVAIDTTQTRPIVYLTNGGNVYKAMLPDPPLPFRQRVDNVVLPTAVVTNP